MPMTAGGFVLNLEGAPFDPDLQREAFERRFLEYTPAHWRDTPNGGSFRFNAEDGKSYTCLFLHSAGHGLFCQIDVWEKKLLDSYVTVFDTDKLEDVVVIAQDMAYPAGCFGDPVMVWEIVSGFLENPTVVQERPWFRRAQDVDWPESDVA